jgi:hypothetical protein
VHLPIGIIFVTLLLEGWRRVRNLDVKPAIWQLLWGTTALSATLSAITGYLLAEKGGYGEELLQQHKQGGIALAILTFIISITYFTSKFDFVFRKLRLVLVPASALLLVYTGHGGGSLTHGADFLSTEMPAETQQVEGKRLTSLDSADIFADAVMPIMQAKCVSCHNDSKKKGDLLLTGYEVILKGGKTRAGVVPGDPSASELYRRITLPEGHKEFMPTDGKKPLSETQVAILEWWIEEGAHPAMLVGSLKPDPRMREVLTEFFQLNRDAMAGYTPEPASDSDLEAVLAAGFQVNRITGQSNLLEVKYRGTEKPNLRVLKRLEEQLVWLHLPRLGLTDSDVMELAELSHLYKLNLSANPLTDKGLDVITRMDKLEQLNLYGTKITAEGVGRLTQLPKLKKLFVWDTGIDSLPPVSGASPKLEIIYRLTP